MQDESKARMVEIKLARLGLVANLLDHDEEILWDVGAIWRENRDVHSRRDAEGFLVLTDRRLMYATFRLGVLVDLILHTIVRAEVTKPRLRMAHLVLSDSGERFSFYTGKRSAHLIVDAVNASRLP